MALVIETIKFRHKQDKDLVITILDIKAEDKTTMSQHIFINV